MNLIPRLILLVACTAPGLLSAAENAPSLLVPAYFYPEDKEIGRAHV